MKTSDQIVSISFFNYQTAFDKWWAFKQMGLAGFALGKVKGLQFFKMLGSGAENGFSIKPNFSKYGMLCVWENEQCANAFYKEHKQFMKFKKRSAEQWTVFLKTAKVHGEWDGMKPFELGTAFEMENLVAVITRATIRTKHIIKFWKFVPQAAQAVENKKGLLFKIGIGERPLVQQATFSLWANSHLMMDYAYRNKEHQKVIQKTRALGWYKEELFARFVPFDCFGSWSGKNPLEGYLENEHKLT